jgi:TRAP-type C4-dicarboxylate transport system permease small subunit
MERVSTNPHQVAALAYAGLGVLVIFITFAADMVPRSRADAVWQLVIGAAFVLFFAVLIWRGWWLLSAVLVLSNLWRAITYFGAGLGLHIELPAFSITSVEPNPAAWINATLMVVIVLLLVRSARIGFSDWRTRRLAERES